MQELIKKGEVTLFLNGWQCYPSEVGSSMIYFKGSMLNNSYGFSMESWLNRLFCLLSENSQDIDIFLRNDLKTFGGFYSLIIVAESEYYLITDIIRSIPIFYGKLKDKLFITDSLEYFQRSHNPFEINSNKLEEFIFSGFVYGRDTVFKNVHGMQAGEIVKINHKNYSSTRYFKFIPLSNPDQPMALPEISKEYDGILNKIFSRIVKGNPNVNNWIVPLSGGHDSRLTLNYLYRLGVKNVICYSYGTTKNEQSNISQQVAEVLNFEWYFVESSENKWNVLHEHGIIDEYISYSFNGVSTPHLQDLLAVYELHTLNILSDGDIFLKSHGDFIVGSQLSDLDTSLTTIENAVNRVVTRHRNINVMSEVSRRVVEEIFRNEDIEPKYFQEYFNWQERQAKFIVNSIKVYEFFGYECLLPFWHRENVDFWLTVPPNLRMGRKIFFAAEMHCILLKELKEIPFVVKSPKTTNEAINGIVKRVMPSKLLVLLLRITGRKVRSNEAMNMIYALRGKSVKKMLAPIKDFPTQTRYYFKDYLHRRPFQMDAHILTSLYTIRKQLDTIKSNSNNS